MTWIVGTCGWLEGFLCVFVCSATVSDHDHDVGDGHAGHDDDLTEDGDVDEDEDEDGVEVERERTMVGQRRIWGERWMRSLSHQDRLQLTKIRFLRFQRYHGSMELLSAF